MQRVVRLCLVATMALVAPGLAAAQTCAGGTDIARGTHRLSLGGAFADGMNGFGVGYGAGSNAFFGNAGIGINKYDGLDSKQFALGSTFGAQYNAGSSPVVFCPVGQVEYAFGPDIDTLDVRMFNLTGGGRMAIVTSDSLVFNVVPTVGLSVVRAALTASLAGDSATLWDTYGMATVGAGLRFNGNRSAVVPSFSIPFALEGSEVSFNVAFTTAF